MTTRAERQAQRVAKLLDRLETAAPEWAESEYEVGIETGRSGTVSAHTETRRAKAEAAVRNAMARLRTAVG
jgi:hypothetical protein